ncbi:DNRLRE domain-containing protein [Kibdelosporangium persicum]|uniref:tRNA nuclease WapA n=1 Tax=Kibdelosporangium persicum TaxID=2698649 RepID=A0ABX2F2X8_9PSEU|nr:DNRLRE domain-containing protein [Kibdelosporangium persicum]NRN65568.1 tRNA nuclease WapA [Kibdelosporangium persicum]
MRRQRPPTLIRIQRRTGLLRGLAAAVAAALVFEAASVSLPDEAVAAPADPKLGPGQAADVPSAIVAARLTGTRVEALAARTETSTTWANPDGKLTTDTHAGPIRYRHKDTWIDIDLSLVKQADGAVTPRAHPSGLKLAGASPQARGGDQTTDLAVLGTADKRMAVQWKGALPEPKLAGSRATYPGVLPGADLIIETTRTGFEQYIELHAKPAEAPTYTLPLQLAGAKLTQLPDGSAAFVDSKTGEQLATMPAPVMWDSTVDPASGEHTRRAPVGMTIKDDQLILTPDAKFLADPATRYPVTVDPATAAIYGAFDTFVQQGYSTDQSSSTELKLGNNGSNQRARSYINWNTAAIAGKQVSAAKLNLFAFHSWSCQARTWEVWPAGLATTATRWGAEPTRTGSAPAATSTETKGYGSGCADGWITADVTNLVKSWADQRLSTAGMGLKAANEDDSYTWKRMNSGNAATNVPFISVTYDSAPQPGDGLGASPPGFVYNGRGVVSSLTPTLSYQAGDAVGDKVQALFQVFDPLTELLVTEMRVPDAPSGTRVSAIVPAGNLQHGRAYKFRATSDGDNGNPAWSPWFEFDVDVVNPGAPKSITSTDYPTGQWVKGAGETGVFTVTPAGGDDQHWLEWSLNNGTWTKVQIGTTASPFGLPITPDQNGTNVLQVRTVDKADNRSEAISYQFHVGPGAVKAPTDGERTARRVPLAAETDGGKFDKVTFSWRRSETDPWAPVPPANVVADGQPLAAWPAPLTGGRTNALAWNVTDTINPDGNVQVRAEFTGPGSATATTGAADIVVDRNAEAAESEEVGPGTVNLITGEFTLSDEDASAFDLAATRSAGSRRPTAGASQEGQAPIFGKEWVSGTVAEAVDTEFTHLRKTSNTSVDLVSEDGDSIHFTVRADGSWAPEPGAESLTLTGALTGSFTLKDTDGNLITLAKVDPAATTWQVTSTAEQNIANSTTQVVSQTVTVDGKKLARPWRLIAPTPAVALATCQTTPSTKGCRVLEMVYATSTTATATALGNFKDQVAEIKLWATDPGASAATASTIAKYAYDAQGRLREVWDPRISPALKTAYTYDAAGRVATLTEPGELPWTFVYGNAGGVVGGDGMLLRVTRPTLKQGTLDQVEGTATTSVVYDVPLTGTRAPHQMGPSDVAAWGQIDVPTDATAIFPPDAVPSANNGGQLTANSYGRAVVHYLNASGQLVNEADEARNIGVAEYDQFGNTVRELSAANRSLALGRTQAERDELTRLGIASLTTQERAELLSTRSTFDSVNRGREVQSLGPLRIVQLENALVHNGTTVLAAGATVPARPKVTHEYDKGRPTNGTAVVTDQITRKIEGAQPRGYPDLLADARVTDTVHDWTKGLAIKSIEDPDGLAITKTTEYDAQGRAVKTLLPQSNGADAGTLVTTYWSATGTGTCAGRPEWADLICMTSPGGAITGGGSNPAQQITTTTEYNREGEPAKVTESANGVSMVTTFGFDTALREITETVTGGVGAAVPVQTTEYDPATGEAVRTTSSTGGTITEQLDKLGRQVSYTDADGGVTRTEYDRLDRPVKVSDSVPSTTTFTYDHAQEPRGLPTSMTDSVAGTFTAKYDADGSVYEEGLPGGYTMRQQEDPTGSPISRTYTRNSDGQIVLSDGVVESIHGQWLKHSGVPGQFSSQKFAYDKAGRLVDVEDSYAGVCTKRSYGFDKRSNRSSLRTASGQPGTACPTTGGDTVTHAYDSGDRIVDPGYVYDAFGRTTAQPNGTTSSYYVNDLVRSQTTQTHQQTWTLDAEHRFRSWTVEEKQEDGTWLKTSSKLNHYDDDADSPRWIVEDTATGVVSRNVSSLGGDLAATTAAAGEVELRFTNLHGDVNLTVPLDPTQAPSVVDSDEYGNTRVGLTSQRYGWLGGKQRSAETVTGSVLMGVRLYNPVTGRFLSVDPVYGGSANAYEYSAADPVNKVDLDGQWISIAVRAGIFACKKFCKKGWNAGKNLFKKKGKTKKPKKVNLKKSKYKQKKKKYKTKARKGKAKVKKGLGWLVGYTGKGVAAGFLANSAYCAVKRYRNCEKNWPWWGGIAGGSYAWLKIGKKGLGKLSKWLKNRKKKKR